MGLLKDLGIVVLAGAVFYGGIRYERHRVRSKIEALQNRIEQMDSIDYKVLSLTVENAKNPEEVREVFEKYDRIVKSPEELKKAIEEYGIGLEGRIK